jgi:hypothetical protein
MGGPGSGRKGNLSSNPRTVYRAIRGTAGGLKRNVARYFAKAARSQALSNRHMKNEYKRMGWKKNW